MATVKTAAAKQSRVQKLAEQRRKLAEEMKELKTELNAGKDQRKAARAAKAQARRDVVKFSSALRKAVIAVKPTVKAGKEKAINKLADTIINEATSLAAHLREFATSSNAQVPSIGDDEEL